MVLNLAKLRLPARNATRWNSQYYMLVILLRVFDIAPELNGKLNATKKHGKLEPFEIKIIRELILILEMFEEASDDFQADYETVGNVIPAYLDMVNKLSITVERNGTEVPNPKSPLTGKITNFKAVAKGLLASLTSRFCYVLMDSSFVLGN
jgi:hypothetical protein